MGCGASPKSPVKEATQVTPVKEVTPSTSSQDSGSTKKPFSEVPPRKLYAIKDAFKAIDVDKKGSIDSSELEALLKKIGNADLSEQERQELFQNLDKDKSGEIQYSEFVEWVVSKEGDGDALENWVVNKGMVELHQAAIAGDVDSIKKLVDSGHKVNAGDVMNVTPLHFAARRGQPAAAAALLEAKADVSARTEDTKRMPLHAAGENGSVPIIELLLNGKADINAMDVRGRAPLHWSCCSSKEDATVVLLKAKADVNIKSNAGYTPYALAEDWSTFNLAQLVKSHGGTR